MSIYTYINIPCITVYLGRLKPETGHLVNLTQSDLRPPRSSRAEFEVTCCAVRKTLDHWGYTGIMEKKMETTIL